MPATSFHLGLSDMNTEAHATRDAHNYKKHGQSGSSVDSLSWNDLPCQSVAGVIYRGSKSVIKLLSRTPVYDIYKRTFLIGDFGFGFSRDTGEDRLVIDHSKGGF